MFEPVKSIYSDLKGKRLLIMDRTALAACAVKRAKEMGIYTVVANFYSVEDSPSKQIADEAIMIDISNVDAMVRLIQEKKINGVFIGWTDSHLPYYVDICQKAKLPCCATKEQVNILSNNKLLFKETCQKYGVPTVPSYKLDIHFRREDLDRIQYPVIVKPADGSGGRGVFRCDNESELIEYYSRLYESSSSKMIVCEKYMDSLHEIFLNYTIQDGFCSLSAAFMSCRAKNENETAASAILHVYPAPYIDLYKEQAENAVIEMFHGIGLKNAVLSLQGFVEQGKIYFHETGLRMGGGQSYLFTQKLNGISALDLMIEFALTGKMQSGNVKKQDNCKFSKPCCNYYIALRPGVISSICGLDKVEKLRQVLQITAFHKIGDQILNTTSLDRVLYRLHVMEDSKESLAEILVHISSIFQIISDKGEDMQIERLTYDRALEMLNDYNVYEGGGNFLTHIPGNDYVICPEKRRVA